MDIGKMLGLARLERDVRKALKQLGLHDDLVELLRSSGESIVRERLETAGVTGMAQEAVVEKLKKL